MGQENTADVWVQSEFPLVLGCYILMLQLAECNLIKEGCSNGQLQRVRNNWHQQDSGHQDAQTTISQHINLI
jgi:hypothetical protein